jgi:hypothetical protein
MAKNSFMKKCMNKSGIAKLAIASLMIPAAASPSLAENKKPRMIHQNPVQVRIPQRTIITTRSNSFSFFYSNGYPIMPYGGYYSPNIMRSLGYLPYNYPVGIGYGRIGECDSECQKSRYELQMEKIRQKAELEKMKLEMKAAEKQRKDDEKNAKKAAEQYRKESAKGQAKSELHNTAPLASSKSQDQSTATLAATPQNTILQQGSSSVLISPQVIQKTQEPIAKEQKCYTASLGYSENGVIQKNQLDDIAAAYINGVFSAAKDISGGQIRYRLMLNGNNAIIYDEKLNEIKKFKLGESREENKQFKKGWTAGIFIDYLNDIIKESKLLGSYEDQVLKSVKVDYGFLSTTRTRSF